MKRILKSLAVVSLMFFASNCLADANDVNDVIIQQGNVDATYGIGYFKALIVDSNVLYTNSANGRVGIGTTSPGAKLEVAGNIICATPTADNHAATKGYVDTRFAQSPYTGAQSITFPNGLILKTGFCAGINEQTVVFDSNFPTACVSVFLQEQHPTDTVAIGNDTVRAISKNQFTCYINPNKAGAYWLAIGY
jgi:hypothetical protein